MKKPKGNSLRSMRQSSLSNKGRGGDKPALIKQSKLRKNPALNPFGIQILKPPNGDVITLLTPEAVEYQYKEICRIFFPDFDKKQRWTLRPAYSDYFIACTYCKHKTIVYTPQLLTGSILVLNVILIHEICHAELGDRCASHGKRWRDRMIEACEVAKKIRDYNLWFALFSESDRYDPESPHYVRPLNGHDCYEQITQLVNEQPDWSFEDVIDWIGRKKFHDPAEILIKRYTKCRQVFEKAKKQVKHVASVRDQR